jgi:hypothetical protein
MDADPELDARFLRKGCCAFPQCPLSFDGALDGVGYAWEFGQNTVASCVGYSSAVFGYFCIENSSLPGQLAQGAIFIGAHQPRESLHVGRKDRSQLPLYLKFLLQSQPLQCA